MELAWLRGDAAGAARWLAAVPPVPGVWGADVGAWEAAWASLAEAEARFAARDSGAGKTALEAALATAIAMGAEPLRTQVEALARRARIRVGTPGRQRAQPDEPTERELEVLALLAEGVTNPQIAERLFLSPKTVGVHVSRLLDKLDAHTRGEAVAVARRRGLLA